MNRLLKTPLFKNTLYIMITNFLIRFLGLFNRIVITRILSIEGMSLYVLITPTIFLFLTISTLSINISTTKIVSEGIETKKISPYKILTEGSKLLFKSQLFTIILFLLLYKFISINLFKNENLLLPLLFSIPTYLITGYTDLIKGYFNGLKKMRYSCNATLIEQVFRIISSIILVILFKKHGIIIAVSMCVLSDAIGELTALFYLLLHLKKDIIKYDNTKNEKELLKKMAFPQTLNRLTNCLTLFLEPIIYTNILILIYNKETITNYYTTFTGYTLPLISIFMFIPQAINSAAMPNLTEIFVKQDYKKSSSFLSKIILFCIIPGILSTIILYQYPTFLMELLYKTTIGADLIKKVVWFYLLYYLHLPLVNAIIALGKTKLNFITSTIFSIVKLLLIIVLYKFGLESIIIANIIILILHTITNIIQIIHLINFKFNIVPYIILLLITIITFSISEIFTYLNLNNILSIFLICIIYLLLLFFFLKSTISGKKSSLST